MGSTDEWHLESRGKLAARVWEKQKREMAPRYGFGFVLAWKMKVGRRFWPGDQR